MHRLLPLLALLLIAACNRSDAGGPLSIAVMGEPGDLEQAGIYLSPAAQHLRAATHEGLVALDPSGEIVPAVAERWIVTDDGLSYIFRLRDSAWPDGDPVEASDVRSSLQERIRELQGTSLGLDLAKIEQIRAMTGRVVEIRLKGPMPDFLRLLAQPEMGFVRGELGLGPMAQDNLAFDGLADTAIPLVALPPEARGLPARENWEALNRPLYLRAMTPASAVDSFGNGEVDLVLSGTLAHLPLADTGPLSTGTVRLDAPLGLFGLQVTSERGVLSEAPLREALAMAIDRSDLMQPFNFGGWQASTWIYPLPLAGPGGPTQERWAQLSQPERRTLAARRVAAWEGSSGEAARVSIGLPQGPGSALLFRELSEDFAAIGVETVRSEDASSGDLVLRDRLARYYSPRWYLNQFNCSLKAGLCAPQADALIAEALELRDLAAKSQLYAEAQRELIARQVFIPLGQPVRWSLVRAGVPGYRENQWGLHPLFPMSLTTI